MNKKSEGILRSDLRSKNYREDEIDEIIKCGEFWWYSEKELIIRLNIIANKLRSEPEKIVRKDGSDAIRVNGIGKAMMALTYCLKQLYNNEKMGDVQVEELYGAVMKYWNE